ncbi:thiamine biosynthesis protein ThiI [Hahella chejuensis KCTC 2396]|uniref:Probable tRNA sulfurtransferase n=2 Tax=Hahella chejuensis TaxID=158327 RepID=Q2SP70_HAHCH|nr:thiamine biosynthesis protein ThiI [Hahella chejuensis KCTC 2396]
MHDRGNGSRIAPPLRFGSGQIMKFLVKLFPEITIKSKPVRKDLVKQLRINIRRVLRQIDENVVVEGSWDKIEVLLPDADERTSKRAIEALQRVSGITNFLVVHEYPLVDFHTIYLNAKALYEEQLEGKRFQVRVKRAGKHDFTSMDLERYVGGGLRQHTKAAGVDLSNPEVIISIEVRDDKYYLVEKRYEGLGGYPVGGLEPVVSLMSGGYDSGVASYLTMKRGMRTHFCFFNLGGTAHEVGVKQAALYLWEKYGGGQRVKFITVPFEGVVAEILDKIYHSNMGVVLKRMMLRAATQVARDLSATALVTGECVAQVSSQTLTNLNVIDSATDMLVLRPLIVTDKQDIIRMAGQIGVEEFARNMPEYCGVISDRPTTKARDYRIENDEKRFDMQVLEQALANRRAINIDEIMQSELTVDEVEVVSTPSLDDIIIDIRHPNEQEKAPLTLTNNKILQIPFYELESRMADLDGEARYLLFCDKGVMSQLHASHLNGNGRKVLVYRPL